MVSKKISLFLSGFRGFSFLVAVVQMLFLSPLANIPLQTHLLLGLVGAYTVAKILVPFKWHQRNFLTYFVLGADALLCVSLVFVTGGLASGFLLYSLNPILTIALLLPRKSALLTAAFFASSVIATQLFSNHIPLPIATAPVGEYLGCCLGILIIYIMVCLLAAFLPFFINANLHRQIEERATVDERKRLAQEIHDDLAQELGYVNLKTRLAKDAVMSGNTERALAELSDFKLAIDSMYTDIRESIDLLRGKTLDSMGLIPTLTDYIHQFGQRSGIRTELFVADGQARFSTLAELHLMRMIQEALTNVRKHTKASKVEVRFKADANWTEVSISDNGQGFEPAMYEGRKERGEHLGIRVMRERAESLGGNVSITSSPEQGTRISIRVPHSKGGS